MSFGQRSCLISFVSSPTWEPRIFPMSGNRMTCIVILSTKGRF